MSFNLEAPKNPNYAATVVALKDFVDLPNCDSIKGALIYGSHVIVSKSVQPGDIGLFFPVETQLSEEFIGQNNLYRKAEWGNADPHAKGFFDQHRRVRCVKFRGHKSEGFWIPTSSLYYLPQMWTLREGDTFDRVGDHEICRKYVPKTNATSSISWTKGRLPRLEDQIVEGQFRFHFDTENLRRNIDKISPDDWISISDKWHGTSVVISKVLVRRSLPWYERLLQKIGVKIQETEVGLVYSSRRVIKEVAGKTRWNNHFYSSDIWGDVAKEVQDRMPEGFTLYGEIVGWTGDGSPIQGGYHYGCLPKRHKFLVYRVTLTTGAGKVVELSWLQMKEFCAKYGFEIVKELWYGQAGGFGSIENRARACMPEFQSEWHRELLADLEKIFVNDGDCPYNDKGTPAEGIVVRIDHLEGCESFKLKNFRFLERESKQLDKGEADIETAQSESVTQ